ncbi:MAG: STAS domain-containing protein [Sporichthyaceae bacterium]
MQVGTTADEELGLVMIALRGAVTTRSAGAVHRVVDAALAGGWTRVLIDLRHLDDVDPALALVLLECDEQLTEAGGWLWLVHGAGAPGSSLRFMGVHDRVRSAPSRQAAGWPAGRC